MPNFYSETNSKYQTNAQQFLDAIAHFLTTEPVGINFLLENTKFTNAYSNSLLLWDEQRQSRDPTNRMKAPFWANYWFEPCDHCNCRTGKSVSMETDAIFFIENIHKQRLALHIEFKRDREPFSDGQADAYRPRALCFQQSGRQRNTLLAHDHFLTILFCGEETDLLEASKHFDRVITHKLARSKIVAYPSS